MCKQGYVGEEEVIRKNMALAQERYTAEYIENLPEDVRAELIDGQIYFFAAPKIVHQRILTKLSARLDHYIEEKEGNCQTLVSPVAVRLDCDDKTWLEPDIIVVCDEDKLREDACYGAPDLVVEIASLSTRQRDYGIKMQKYRAAGVKEYWIVDLEKKIVFVCWFEDEGWNNLYSFEDEISFHLFPELTVRIADFVRAGTT